MILRHSGYIFGKYVQPQNVVQQIYFDNGQFNNLYVPSDFDYDLDICNIKATGSQRTYTGYPGEFLERYYPEHLIDESIPILQSYHYVPATEKFVINNNLLVLDHVLTDPGWTKTAVISILLPMVNYFHSINSKYSKINITCRRIKDSSIVTTASFGEVIIYLYTRKSDGSRGLQRIGYYYNVPFISQEWTTLSIDISGIDAPADIDYIAIECSNFSTVDYSVDAGKHVIYQIKKIWADCIN